MGQFAQTNGDYIIKTGEGADIKLDTGPGVGNVRVTGNLIVEGDTLTVSAENLNVNDNIIVLNFGETGSGVTLRYSGIQIDRGTSQPASLIFDENDDIWLFTIGSPEGTLTYTNSKIRLKEIHTNSDTDTGDLGFNVGANGVLKILSSGGNYDLRVTNDDDIPNKKYVDDAIQLSPTYQIKSPGTGSEGDTRVIIADKDVTPNIASEPGSIAAYIDQTGDTTFGESAVTVFVDGQKTVQFFKDFVTFQDLEFNQNEITSSNTNGNIYIRTQGTGKLQTNYAIQLEKIAGTPAFITDSVLINAATPGLGDSGVFFTNSVKSDELISRNKAFVLSMLF
jgi:hypothetical protein